MKKIILMSTAIALLAGNLLLLASCGNQKEESVSSGSITSIDDYFKDDASSDLTDSGNSGNAGSSQSTSSGSVTVSSSSANSNGTYYDPTTYNANTDWFMKAKYGLFIHYLYQVQNDPTNVKGLAQGKQTSWDECVNEFDVNKFASNANDCGAGYVIFSVMQLTQYMIAPNETYNQITGFKTGEACSTRDLIADLITALDKYNIKLMLYFTGDGPSKGTQTYNAFSMDKNANPQFREKWYSVAKEYSMRYGSKIYGWWVDGCHLTGYNDKTLGEFAAALKAGNPKSIVCFNPGDADKDVRYYTSADDYTAGERNSFFSQVPKSRFVNNDWPTNKIQWHIASFLGTRWADTNVQEQYTPRKMADYIKQVSSVGGVVSIDVGTYRDGHISERQVECLAGVKERLAA